MAQVSGFFTAQQRPDGSYDRSYTAEQFAYYFSKFIGNGIYATPVTQLQVSQSNAIDMSVNVNIGDAYINGWWFKNTNIVNLPIAAANGVNDRIDLIVVRWSKLDRDIRLAVVQGIAAPVPQIPELTRNNDVYELCLARVDVDATATTITNTMITDKRYDSSVCGMVKGVIDQIDTTNLFQQFQAVFDEWYDGLVKYADNAEETFDNLIAKAGRDLTTMLENSEIELDNQLNDNQNVFEVWFESIKDMLSGDIAANLQKQIDEIKDELPKYKEDEWIDGVYSVQYSYVKHNGFLWVAMKSTLSEPAEGNDDWFKLAAIELTPTSRSKTETEEGKQAVDIVELNPEVKGTIAEKVNSKVDGAIFVNGALELQSEGKTINTVEMEYDSAFIKIQRYIFNSYNGWFYPNYFLTEANYYKENSRAIKVKNPLDYIDVLNTMSEGKETYKVSLNEPGRIISDSSGATVVARFECERYRSNSQLIDFGVKYYTNVKNINNIYLLPISDQQRGQQLAEFYWGNNSIIGGALNPLNLYYITNMYNTFSSVSNRSIVGDAKCSPYAYNINGAFSGSNFTGKLELPYKAINPNLAQMFYGCRYIKGPVPEEEYWPERVQSAFRMFQSCPSLQGNVYVPKYEGSRMSVFYLVSNYSGMYNECYNVKGIGGIPEFENHDHLGCMPTAYFSNTSLQNPLLNNQMQYIDSCIDTMFFNCYNLEGLKFSNQTFNYMAFFYRNTSKLAWFSGHAPDGRDLMRGSRLDYAFTYQNLMTGNIIGYGNASGMSHAFQSCSNIGPVINIFGDLPESYYAYAFTGCTNVTHLDMNINTLNNAYYAFDGCTNLTDVNIKTNRTSMCNMYSMFGRCPSLKNIEVYFNGQCYMDSFVNGSPGLKKANFYFPSTGTASGGIYLANMFNSSLTNITINMHLKEGAYYNTWINSSRNNMGLGNLEYFMADNYYYNAARNVKMQIYYI